MVADPEATGPALLQQMFEAMPVGVALFDTELRLQQWNDAFYRFLADYQPDLASRLHRQPLRPAPILPSPACPAGPG